MNMKAVTVVGIGDDGCLGLSSAAMGAVARAHILAGGERHLDFFPQFDGRKIVFKGEIMRSVEEIADLAAENTICVLASGDPLYFGIGGLISKKVGPQYVEFIPSPSSIQRAFAKIACKWDDSVTLSLHGRPLTGFINKLQRLHKVACFTDGMNNPRVMAQTMKTYDETDWTAYVCEHLGGGAERIRKFSILELCEETDITDLNVVILIRNNSSWQVPPPFLCLEEEAYAKRMPKNGLITKREIRVLSLAAMGLRPNSVVWDIGAGSGSVAIEAAKIVCDGEVYAIEVDSEGVEICKQNVLMHKTDNVQVIHGRAPEALMGLKDPDAVFIGGSKGSMAELIELCLKRLKKNGRIVANAITLDNVAEAYQTFRQLKILPEVNLVQISRGQPLASYQRYEALNPIHIFSATKPEEKH